MKPQGGSGPKYRRVTDGSAPPTAATAGPGWGFSFDGFSFDRELPRLLSGLFFAGRVSSKTWISPGRFRLGNRTYGGREVYSQGLRAAGSN